MAASIWIAYSIQQINFEYSREYFDASYDVTSIV